MITEAIRRMGYWCLDMAKGGKVRKKYMLIGDMYKTGTLNQAALDELLAYAKAHVPAYANVKDLNLHSFPVVTKNDYRERYRDYQSDEYLDTSKLHEVHTSGSTGQPFTAYMNPDKVQWHQAGLLRLNDEIGWHMGKRFVFMRNWGKNHTANGLSLIIKNCVPFNVLYMNDENWEKLRKRLLKDKSLHLILGYASALGLFAEYLDKFDEKPEDYGLKLIIADSDNLTEKAKVQIEKVFGCPVLNRYANEENGILAITHEHDDRMFVNFPEYFMEVLKPDCNEPAAPGEVGRIVVTDLYNKAFPFIRYDTGDYGIADEVVDGYCMVLRSLEGRCSAALCNTQGKMLTELMVNGHFSRSDEISRYQLVQTGKKNYTMRVEGGTPDVDPALIQRCKACFGEDAEVVIEHVDNIPQGKNGKYKTTVYDVKE